MGAWGTGVFENDDAMDWVAELLESADSQPLLEAINRVVESPEDEDVEVDACSHAVAAVAVLAVAGGTSDVEVPDDVQKWIDNHDLGDATELATSGRKALRRIVKSSEMKDLWEEAEDWDLWREIVRELDAALKELMG